jgi:hypothetical protein
VNSIEETFLVDILEEIERFDKALRLVERYEGYLFRRALGIALIICGIVFPLTAFMVLKAQIIANLLNMSPQAFLTFIPTFILVIGINMIVYSFTSAHVVTSRMQEKSVWKDAPHMVLMFMVWFVSFYLTNFVPEPFTVISWLWAGGGASLLSYLLMKRDPANVKFTELLIIGIICIVSSLPLLFIRDEQLVLTATFLVFSMSFITVGLYSTVNASKLLSEGEK